MAGNLEKGVKAKLQRRARLRGRGTEEVRGVMPHAVRDEDGAKPPLGGRLRELFAGIGLEEDIPEIRGRPARPADLGPWS
jgi:antitoxin FitA